MVTNSNPSDDLPGWIAGRLPDGWFTGPPEVTADRDDRVYRMGLDDE